MVPKKHVEQVGNDAFGKQPIGTGPFKFVSRKIKETVELEAHKDHWGHVPGVDKLSLRVVPDAQTRVAMLQTGEADVVIAIPPHIAKGIEDHPETKMVVSPSFQTIEIVLSNRGPHAGLKSTKVRQALNLAVDKQAMIQKVMFGYAKQSTAPCNVDLLGCDIDRKPYGYDPKKAKAMLEEEKFDFSKPLKMFAQAGGRVAQSKEVMEAVVFYLGQVGVKVDVEFMEYGAWLAGLGSKQFDKYDGLYRNWTEYNNDPMGRPPRARTSTGHRARTCPGRSSTH
jgi:peptide/nickel transport system substrate-binding protein